MASRPRGREVAARLVELDPELAATARGSAAEAGLTGVDVVTADAGLTDAYPGMVPADLVLGTPQPLVAGARMFTFAGRAALARDRHVPGPDGGRDG